ncbi:MAG: DUF4982 domain-containing protein [Prevotellaceae bacterium]|jgi:beta-galactosidase/beta-glucuronidase|nr:DUF4982 domain-containing protein [Prevotellaceae bacterium]
MINKILLFLLILISTGHKIQSQVSFGRPEKINDNWFFTLNNTSYQQYKESKLLTGFDIFSLNDTTGKPPSNFDAKSWQTIDLPHDWSVKFPLGYTLASSMGYLPGGVGWYGKILNIPKEKQGEKAYLYFEGVYNRSEVFVNGRLLGKRPNGYVSFMYDITSYIKYGENNVIAVKVDHSQSADSRWYTGSGIYRNVWLVYANPVHISQWGIFARSESVSPKRAILHVDIEIENGTNTNHALVVNNELISAEGKTVAKDSRKFPVPAKQKNTLWVDLKVNNPQEWDLENPRLYLLKTTVIKDGVTIDETTTKTGFRTFVFNPDKGFALNGKWMKMKGVCIHHDAGVLGAAVPREVWKQRLLALKETGCNAIRTSHNPQSPDLYELCDELGFLVMDEAFDEWEFPKRKWLDGWNIGTPGFQGSFDFFEKWGENDLADMVRRDRNHLSVFAWSIGNEVDYPNDPYSHPVLDGGANTGFTQAIFGGYKKEAPNAMRLGDIARRLVAVVKRYDNSRPVTAGLAGVAMSNETGYPGALDIAGYNYTENRYDSDHKKYPKRVIYGSENRHDVEAWKAVTENEHIFGQFLWTGIDYLGESGRWPSRGFYSGLLDFGGEIKPRGYFRQSLWSDKPMIYIGTYPVQNSLSQDAWPVWNYNDETIVRVVCYTNAAKARLELNGKIAGETKDYDVSNGIIYWDIPYSKGKLEAVGMDDAGNETGRYAIRSSGRPFAITVEESVGELSKDGGLARIVLQIVDEEGIPVMLSDDEITCYIDGPARLIGMEASNNQDMSSYTDNKHRVFHGRIVVYIQATGKPGNVKIYFNADWLKNAETKIMIQ